jgi:hypothetical protein
MLSPRGNASEHRHDGQVLGDCHAASFMLAASDLLGVVYHAFSGHLIQKAEPTRAEAATGHAALGQAQSNPAPAPDMGLPRCARQAGTAGARHAANARARARAAVSSTR